MNKKTKTILSIIVIAILILSCYFMYGKPAKAFSLSYDSVRKTVSPMMVNIDDKNLISASVCFASATNDGKGYYVPLFFTTGESLPSHINEKYHPTTVLISSFGKNPSDVSIKIAETYWSRIELVVIVSNYNDALISAPLASYLNAPLIFKGSNVQNFLDRNHINNAIIIGSEDYDVGIKRLNNRAEIWNYYLERLEENGDKCDYIVVTNPNDVSKDVMIPYLSLNTAVLASYRKAIVVTGDYTIEQSWTMQLGYGTGDAGSGERGEDTDTLTDDDEIVLQKNINSKAIKIDNDIDYAANFLEERNMEPQYLALVGGPVALPMLYIKNPIWYENPQEEKGEEYLATDSYYSDLDIKLESDKNVKGEYICYGEPGEYNGSNYEYANPELYTPELAVGRIVASNVLDGSALVVRSLGYDETPEFHSILTSFMCGDASQNCARHQRAEVFLPNGILSTRLQWLPPSTTGFWKPGDTSSSHTAGNPALMTKANFIIYNGHGFPDGWYYWWMHAHDYDNSGDTIRTEDVRTLEMKPSIVFSASCLCSALDWPTIWAGATDEKRYDELGPDMYFPLGLIHAGALAHIGSTEESWGAFFGGEFNGYGDFELATMYFDELLSNDLSIGKAHSVARQNYYSTYNSVFDKTCFLENVLYGEPAVNP
ncbi:MAG: hypothetical protein KJ655_05665 [Candidatus Thermoplasmatota archaeon]|nr:hypothetical protein [Candidatus Thermoplasmatota archaeon]